MRAPLTEVLARTAGGSPTLDLLLNPIETDVRCHIFHVDQWKDGEILEIDESTNMLVGFVYDPDTELAANGSPTEGWELPLTRQEVATIYPSRETAEA
jgi:hypothetical protein